VLGSVFAEGAAIDKTTARSPAEVRAAVWVSRAQSRSRGRRRGREASAGAAGPRRGLP